MTDNQEWIKWTGGENPVPGKMVIFRFRDEWRTENQIKDEIVASYSLVWSEFGDSSIVKYRVIEEEQKTTMRKFESGAVRDTNENKLDYKGFLSMIAINQFSEYMHKNRKQADGSMRGSDNWKLGIPVSAYEESFTRHVFEWLTALEYGDRDKAYEIAPAIFFNLQGWMHEEGKLRKTLEVRAEIEQEVGRKVY